MVLFKKGCCCVSLQRFTLGVGWLGCVQSVFAMLRVLLTLVDQTNEHYGFMALKLVVGAIHFFVCIELIRGAQNSNGRLVLPWLIYNVIMLILVNVLIAYHIFIVYVIKGNNESVLQSIAIWTVVLALIDAWWIYVWLCIYSFYQEQENHENMEKI